MRAPLAILRAVGKGVLNAVGFGVLGEVVVEVLPEVAEDVYVWWKGKRTPDQQREELQHLAQAPISEVREEIQAVVAEIAGDQPLSVRENLSIYLSLLPGAIRQTMRRPADPGGLTIPPALALSGPDDILPLLPVCLPRFKVGDRPLPGTDWEVVELLGAGGFGEVWKARNAHFDAVPPVALKFCLDATARDRLLRHEAAILNQVMRQGRHPGIVSLLHTYLSADPPCLEYEYVAGGDLGQVIREWQREPPKHRAEAASELVLDLARIVSFAHQLRPPIVHRDLKPANILVQQKTDGSLQLRVADFGIGAVAAGQAIARTREASQGPFLVSALRGAHTPLYASPQQMRGAPADPRDDVFSLGVIWYQLLTGNLTASRPGGTRWTRRLAELGMSDGLIDLLGACVEEEVEDRPVDAGALSTQLAALLQVKKPTIELAPVSEPPRPDPSHDLRRPAPAVRVLDLAPKITNLVGMSFAVIRPGAFLMGSPPTESQRGGDEGPQRLVVLSRPYYLGIHPATQQAFEKVIGVNPSQFHEGNGGGVLFPVEQVSWNDAVAFCQHLTQLFSERKSRRSYRLPTEAEWEYACRAGSTTPFAHGVALSAKDANFDGSRPYGGAGADLRRTCPWVGGYAVNAWGLCDMHGNVWEWCADWYDEHAYENGPNEDPCGPSSGSLRVLRGGSWNNSGHLCRSARRNKYAPDFRSDTIGFRVVLEVAD